VSHSDVEQTITLNVAGNRFVASSVAVIDSVQLATVVTSSTTMTATVGPTDINTWHGAGLGLYPRRQYWRSGLQQWKQQQGLAHCEINVGVNGTSD